MANLQISNAPRVGRKLRSPQHRFNLRTSPFAIQPFLLAPVIPGETMKNLLIQSRVVTDPVLNKLIGWWKEYYVFYVKHRDLDGRDDFTAMMLDLEHPMTGYIEGGAPRYYYQGTGINWARLCLKRVVETYFREEGQAWDNFLIDTMPAAAVNVESYIGSAVMDDAYIAEDVNVDLNANAVITAGEVERAMQTWQFMRANQMTEMTYEDWLATYGIKSAKQELHRPELLRYLREWQYPSNTINPVGGAATSAVSWAIRDRADKDRFFPEPGFIFGVTVTRPKVYLSNTRSSAANTMSNALTWLPALMREDPWTSMRKLAETEGPLQTIVADINGYWIDIKDILLYGDEFVNVNKPDAAHNSVALPNADLTNKLYPSITDTDAMFAGTAKFIREDGVVSLSILGTQQDTTPPASSGN